MSIRGRNKIQSSKRDTHRAPSANKSLSESAKRKLSNSARMILRVLAAQDWNQLAWRTGLVASPANVKRTLPLPLMLKVARKKTGEPRGVKAFVSRFDMFGLTVFPFWFNEFRNNKALTQIPAYLNVDAADPARMPDGESVEDRLGKILGTGLVEGIALAGQHGPLRAESLGDIGMPIARTYKGKRLTGAGVVVGIIDDGCAFANQDFLRNVGSSTNPLYQARTVRLWDQATPPTPTSASRGWAERGNGREITAAKIEAAINGPVGTATQGWVEEEAVYDYLEYPMGRVGKLASHGARVMGIAAGNGRSAMGSEGVAPDADVVFVHVPPTLLDVNPSALTNPILDGIRYIFDYAEANNQAAVVNISLGGYAHAHNGSSPWETTMDTMLQTPGRCIVVSAGNGFEADCHIQGALGVGKTATYDWWINPHDPTPNDLELWYDAGILEISVVTPEGVVYGPYKSGTSTEFPAAPAMAFGHIEHQLGDNGEYCATVWLAQTCDEPLPGLPAPPVAGKTPAPAGNWKLRIRNAGIVNVEFHAWIQRDDTGPPGARRRQSRFDPDQADPRSTICDLATGSLTISVGAHNVATQELAGYSAAGPTRAHTALGTGKRPKPDVIAPGEEAPPARGVLATSSARANPSRLGGTSASAPHVAGMIALILEYANSVGASLTAGQIQAALQATADPANLRKNRHQRAASTPVIKQAQVWNDVVGYGKADLNSALRFLFP
jgi:hypothetical protein